MTDEFHIDDSTALDYTRARLRFEHAASVEAHLMRCARCRASLTATVPPQRMERIWDDVVASGLTPRRSLRERVLRWCGLRGSTARLLSIAQTRRALVAGAALLLLGLLVVGVPHTPGRVQAPKQTAAAEQDRQMPGVPDGRFAVSFAAGSCQTSELEHSELARLFVPVSTRPRRTPSPSARAVGSTGHGGATSASSDDLHRPTLRERQLLALIASGPSNAEVADWPVSGEAAAGHVRRVMLQLELQDRSAAVITLCSNTDRTR
jgi:hypothetical protein